jgi:hypothetical protein
MNYNYSKAHQNLAQLSDSPDVYNNPEKYLGPNYASVLNFWWYLESLTVKQLLELENKYMLNYGKYNARYDALVSHAEGILGYRRRANVSHSSRSHVRDIIFQFPNIPAPVSLELIALQTILDKGEELIFIPMLSF